MEKMSRNITIFEGPDGSGKSTLAEKFAKETGALYIHFDAMKNVNNCLGRIYAEAMLPALLGYQDLVFDRSWLSENPYNIAFHKGKERLTVIDMQMLERLAMRCGTVVVHCQPSWETVKSNYLGRKEIEMLDNEHQLKQVYDLYTSQETYLPKLKYDYTKDDSSITQLIDKVEAIRLPKHPVTSKSTGNWDAKKVIIGNPDRHVCDTNTFYNWPFVSFDNNDYNHDITYDINSFNIDERELLWLDVDQDLSLLTDLNIEKIIATDDNTYDIIKRLELPIELNNIKLVKILRNI